MPSSHSLPSQRVPSHTNNKHSSPKTKTDSYAEAVSVLSSSPTVVHVSRGIEPRHHMAVLHLLQPLHNSPCMEST